MARKHDDSWDLASSVGTTATMIAAGRAMATKDPRALIEDRFAAPLVEAVGLDFFTKLVNGDLDLSTIENAPARAQAMIDGIALRTKYFDDRFIDATDAGVRQAVILASGLDARAYRLAWPDGTVVYEVDQPQVIEFKTTTLAGIGAQPTATRRTVSVDLREDWPVALQAAGLDTTIPTAWSAEGLLIYLPPEAQDRLFDNITRLSAPGSTIATEYVPGLKDFDAAKARAMTDRFREYGFDIDMSDLIYAGERNHAAGYLTAKGWQMTTVAEAELFAEHDIPRPPANDDNPMGEIVYISGIFTGSEPVPTKP